MARIALIQKNKKILALVNKYSCIRQELKNSLKKATTFAEAMSIKARLHKLPRNSSITRFRHRCALTGRTRGYLRAFDLSRIALRDQATKGLLGGVTKSSF